MTLSRLCAFAALAALFLNSCNSTTTESVPTVPSVPVSALRLTPDTLTIDNEEYFAQITPWRDYMPSPMSTGPKGLLVNAWLVRCDSLPIPEQLDMQFLWLVNGEEVWAGVFEEEQQATTGSFGRLGVVRNGPKWEPGSDIWAVLGFVDASGTQRFVRTTMSTIMRTE